MIETMFVAAQASSSSSSLFPPTFAALIFSSVYGYRMHVEEELLAAELGDAYVSYLRRAKRLIPYVF